MFPYEIAFADCDASPAITKSIVAKLKKIQKIYDRVTTAHVKVRMYKKGVKKIFDVHIQLDLPGATLYVQNRPTFNYAHTDIHIAIRDSFQKMKRRLEDFVHQRVDASHAPAPIDMQEAS